MKITITIKENSMKMVYKEGNNKLVYKPYFFYQPKLQDMFHELVYSLGQMSERLKITAKETTE